MQEQSCRLYHVSCIAGEDSRIHDALTSLSAGTECRLYRVSCIVGEDSRIHDALTSLSAGTECRLYRVSCIVGEDSRIHDALMELDEMDLFFACHLPVRWIRSRKVLIFGCRFGLRCNGPFT